MKFVLYRSSGSLEKDVRKHELVAVEYGNNIDEVTDALISDVKNDLAELPEYKCCTGSAAYPPERTEGIRRAKKYKYEILGVVFPQYGEKNILVEYGITEAEESQ